MYAMGVMYSISNLKGMFTHKTPMIKMLVDVFYLPGLLHIYRSRDRYKEYMQTHKGILKMHAQEATRKQM